MYLKCVALAFTASLLISPVWAEDSPSPELIMPKNSKTQAAPAGNATAETEPTRQQKAETEALIRDHARAVYMMEGKISDPAARQPYAQILTDCVAMVRALDRNTIKYSDVDKLEKKLGEIVADGTITKKEFADWDKTKSGKMGHGW